MEIGTQFLSDDIRRMIHDLTILNHSTGLSPPEEELLVKYEADEARIPE